MPNFGFWFSRCPYCVKLLWHAYGIYCRECKKWFHLKCFSIAHNKSGIDVDVK